MRARELEISMGNGKKIIEKNERNSSFAKKINKSEKGNNKNQIITKEDLIFLRPSPLNALPLKKL